jgi:putative phage-type endonuclease
MIKQDLGDRTKYIGGSDAGSIAGLNPWKSEYQLWLEKTGQEEPADLSQNARVEWGTRLEDAVAQAYSETTGMPVEPVGSHEDPQYPFIVAHIDRDIPGTDGILECKTAGSAHGWGEPMTDEVPDQYFAQVQHYMFVSGKKWCDIAVLIGGSDFRIYHIDRDDDFIDALVKLEVEFWRKVQAMEPPAITTGADARLAYKRSLENAIEADSDTYNVVSDLVDLKAHIKELEARQEDLEGRIMATLGENDTLTFHGSKLLTWKTQTTSRWDTKTLEQDHPELVGSYKKPSASRVMRISIKKGA